MSVNQISSNTNGKYKDRLFCTIFGKEENKPFLLELYNALNNSNYTNLDDIEFTTIENVIYITAKNDVSFIIGSELNLYEQQSTFNPNMPLRGLMYFSQAYQMYLSSRGKDLYGTTLVKIPRPKYVVFYNGNREIDDITKLYLSDSFEQPNCNLNQLNKFQNKEFEWTATIININKNHNDTLLKKCKSLYDYSRFVEMVKNNLRNGNSKDDAVRIAVNEGIKQNFFNGYLKKSKSEVQEMSLTEFDQEEYDKNRREEGATQKAIETARLSLQNNLQPNLIAKITGLSLAEIEKLKEQIKQETLVEV